MNRYLAMPVKRNFIFLDKFNDFIGRMFESGITTKWWNDISYVLNTTALEKPDWKSPQKINLGHMEGPMYILLIGYGIAFLIFLCEMFRFRFVLRNARM